MPVGELTATNEKVRTATMHLWPEEHRSHRVVYFGMRSSLALGSLSYVSVSRRLCHWS